MDIHARVRRALAAYEALPDVTLDNTISPENLYLATPDRVSYALGWLVAAEIVRARFLNSAIDAIPIFHPRYGWDRFVLTRRVSCAVCSAEPANKFGMLMLDGDDGPRLTSPSGATRLALGRGLRDAPREAISALLNLIPSPPLPEGRHSRCLHHRARHYPDYYMMAAEMIVQHPRLVVSREIHIDADAIDGAYHPLYLHAIPLGPESPGDRHGVLTAATVYDWFQFQYGDSFAFMDTSGDRAIHRTDRDTWARAVPSPNSELVATVRERLNGWLSISNATDCADSIG